MKKRTIYQVMLCNNIIYKLFEQQAGFPVGVSYRIYKLKKELDEVEEFINDRWDILFGKGYDVDTFGKEEIELYNGTLLTEVDIDTFGLVTDDIVGNDKVVLTLKDMQFLDLFLS